MAGTKRKMSNILALIREANEVEESLDRARQLERELVKKREQAHKKLVDGYVELLSACPADVLPRVLRYFREKERIASTEGRVSERVWE